MFKPIFDYSDGDYIYPISGNMGIDSEVNLHMRMSDNTSIDMNTGELNIISDWKYDNNNDEY